MPSTRPALAALGLIAACAACCALPLLLGVVAAGGALIWIEAGALAAVSAIGLGAWLLWRRRKAGRACAVLSQTPGGCSKACDCR